MKRSGHFTALWSLVAGGCLFIASCSREKNIHGAVLFQDQDQFPYGTTGLGRMGFGEIASAGLITHQEERDRNGDLRMRITIDSQNKKVGAVAYKIETFQSDWRSSLYSLDALTGRCDRVVYGAFLRTDGCVATLDLKVVLANGATNVATPDAHSRISGKKKWTHATIRMPVTSTSEVIRIDMGIHITGSGKCWVDGVELKSQGY